MGASEEEWAAQLGGLPAERGGSKHCRWDSAGEVDICLGRKFELGGIILDPLYFFRAGRFARVWFSFKSTDFSRLADVFVERYVLPTESTNRARVWIGPNVTITLQRSGPRITEGFAWLSTRAEVAEMKRRREEQTKDAAKGL